MLLAIDSFVRLFEGLLSQTAAHARKAVRHADNDNDETDEEERRWAAFR